MEESQIFFHKGDCQQHKFKNAALNEENIPGRVGFAGQTLDLFVS